MQRLGSVLPLLIVFNWTCTAEARAQGRGEVVLKKLPQGEYQRYLPRQAPVGVLVIAHGTPEPGENVPALAAKFLKRWVTFAEAFRLIAVVPVFDDDYGGPEETPTGVPAGGYRGLFGREIGADDFVHRIIEREAKPIKNNDGRFYLYDHSAGGQFAGRYCVRHPDRIRGAVLSAADRYAFPNPDAPWPYGMGVSRIKANVEGKAAPVTPDSANWPKAAQLPLAVVVGSADTSEQPARAGHKGTTRIDFSRQWVDEMNGQGTPPGRVQFVLVNGIGHDSAGLTPKCQEVLSSYVKSSADPRKNRP